MSSFDDGFDDERDTTAPMPRHRDSIAIAKGRMGTMKPGPLAAADAASLEGSDSSDVSPIPHPVLDRVGKRHRDSTELNRRHLQRMMEEEKNDSATSFRPQRAGDRSSVDEDDAPTIVHNDSVPLSRERLSHHDVPESDGEADNPLRQVRFNSSFNTTFMEPEAEESPIRHRDSTLLTKERFRMRTSHQPGIPEEGEKDGSPGEAAGSAVRFNSRLNTTHTEGGGFDHVNSHLVNKNRLRKGQDRGEAAQLMEQLDRVEERRRVKHLQPELRSRSKSGDRAGRSSSSSSGESRSPLLLLLILFSLMMMIFGGYVLMQRL